MACVWRSLYVAFVCVSMHMLLPAQSKKTCLHTKGMSGNSELESHLFRSLLACSLTETNKDYGMACRYGDMLLLHVFKRSREMTMVTGLRLLIETVKEKGKESVQHWNEHCDNSIQTSRKGYDFMFYYYFLSNSQLDNICHHPTDPHENIKCSVISLHQNLFTVFQRFTINKIL